VSQPKLARKQSGFGGRGYGIPGRTHPSPNTGKPLQTVYPSVTTILKAVAKPGLHQWIADQTAAYAVMNVSYLQQVAEEVAWRRVRFYWSGKPKEVAAELRTYHEGVRDDSAEMGTNIHGYIEADVDEFASHPPVDSDEMDEMVYAWEEWFATHEVQIHNTEFTLVNDTDGWAGTADGDWTITCKHAHDEQGYYCLGKAPGPHRTLVDVKSARHTWPEHGYQLAGLAAGEVLMVEAAPGAEGAKSVTKTENGQKITTHWLEETPPEWQRFALLHIRPDDLDKDGQLVPAFCKLIDMTEDMDVYAEGFQGAFALTKTQKTLKERAKKRNRETVKLESPDYPDNVN
jgi:hypothetical protein